MKQTTAKSRNFLTQIRARFANVSADPFTGKRIYLENAGGTLKLKSIFPLLAELTALPDNAGRNNAASKKLEAALADGRAAVAALLGARSGQIMAEQSVTGMMFRLLRTIARHVKGRNMVTTNLDHASVYDATHILARQYGHEARIAQLDPRTGTVPTSEILRHIDRDTVVLTLIHSSNILGTKHLVAEIVKAARAVKPDLFIILDGAQHASHGLVDVEAYGADAYVFAPYKTYAKLGITFAHLSDRLANLPHDNLVGKAKAPWDLGTREVAAYACMTPVVEYLRWLAEAEGKTVTNLRDSVVKGMAVIERLELDLMRVFLHGQGRTPGLLKLPGVTVHGQIDRLADRESIFAFSVANHPTVALLDYFQQHGIILHNRVSDAYSGHTLAGIGVSECLRVSACHYNTPAEVLRFLSVLAKKLKETPSHA